MSSPPSPAPFFTELDTLRAHVAYAEPSAGLVAGRRAVIYAMHLAGALQGIRLDVRLQAAWALANCFLPQFPKKLPPAVHLSAAVILAHYDTLARLERETCLDELLSTVARLHGAPEPTIESPAADDAPYSSPESAVVGLTQCMAVAAFDAPALGETAAHVLSRSKVYKALPPPMRDEALALLCDAHYTELVPAGGDALAAFCVAVCERVAPGSSPAAERTELQSLMLEGLAALEEGLGGAGEFAKRAEQLQRAAAACGRERPAEYLLRKTQCVATTLSKFSRRHEADSPPGQHQGGIPSRVTMLNYRPLQLPQPPKSPIRPVSKRPGASNVNRRDFLDLQARESRPSKRPRKAALSDDDLSDDSFDDDLSDDSEGFSDDDDSGFINDGPESESDYSSSDDDDDFSDDSEAPSRGRGRRVLDFEDYEIEDLPSSSSDDEGGVEPFDEDDVVTAESDDDPSSDDEGKDEAPSPLPARKRAPLAAVDLDRLTKRAKPAQPVASEASEASLLPEPPSRHELRARRAALIGVPADHPCDESVALGDSAEPVTAALPQAVPDSWTFLAPSKRAKLKPETLWGRVAYCAFVLAEMPALNDGSSPIAADVRAFVGCIRAHHTARIRASLAGLGDDLAGPAEQFMRLLEALLALGQPTTSVLRRFSKQQRRKRQSGVPEEGHEAVTAQIVLRYRPVDHPRFTRLMLESKIDLAGGAVSGMVTFEHEIGFAATLNFADATRARVVHEAVKKIVGVNERLCGAVERLGEEPGLLERVASLQTFDERIAEVFSHRTVSCSSASLGSVWADLS